MKIYGEVLKSVKDNNPYPNGWSTYDQDIRILESRDILDLYETKIKLGTKLKVKFILAGNESQDILKNYRKLQKSGKMDKNLCVIIFSGNESADPMPFTPWILIHRAFHPITIYEPIGKDLNIKHQINRICSILIYLTKLFKESRQLEIKTINNLKYEYYENVSIVGSLKDLEWIPKRSKGTKINQYVFTFRSARTETRLIDIDIIAELFAQMFICGKIKLFDVDKIPDEIIPKENKLFLKEKYKEVEEMLNDSYSKIIQDLGGKIYCF